MFAESGVFVKLLLLIGLVLVGMVSFMLLGMLVVGVDMANNDTIRILQGFQTIGAFILPPFVFTYLCNQNQNNITSFLYLEKGKVKAIDLLYLALLMVMAIPFVNFLGGINQNIQLPEWLSGLEEWMKAKETQTEEITLRIVNVESIGILLLNILIIALLPAFGEELLFRSALFRAFDSTKNKHLVVWLTAAIFSAIHLQFYGFLPRMLLGAGFGYMLLWTGSLYPAIIMHFVNNALIVIVYYLTYNNHIALDLDNIGSDNTWWFGCISGILTILGFLLFRKKFLDSE